MGFSPIGINCIYCATGELSHDRVARDLNLPYCLSSAGSYSIEDTAKTNDNGTRFFQLYWGPDEKVTMLMLDRAARSGYTACVLTTDTCQLGWRHDDVAMGNYAFYHHYGASDLGLQDPAFLKGPKESGLDPEAEPMKTGANWIDEHIWHGRSHTWVEIPNLMKQWKDISGGKALHHQGNPECARCQEGRRAGGRRYQRIQPCRETS